MTTFFLVALFGLVAVLFAVLVVATRQPMRAALALVAHMISLAAIYAVLDVHVVALFQVLVYVGAVMVFMVYTIMLLDDRDPSFTQPFTHPLVALSVALAVAVALLWTLGSPTAAGVNAPAPVAGLFGFRGFALGFMTQYAWHFELATVLLLVGIVAAWTAVREALGTHA